MSFFNNTLIIIQSQYSSVLWKSTSSFSPISKLHSSPLHFPSHLCFSASQIHCSSSSGTYMNSLKSYDILGENSNPKLLDMDAAPAGQSLYPLHRCKTLHLLRHAQGVHNVKEMRDRNSLLSDDLFDAHLTPLGWSQVDGLRKHVKACGLSKRIDLVIVSPLLRTMQTAVGVFGGEACGDEISAPPLMKENVGDSGRPAISSLNSPPFVAVELCREQWGILPCDKRRSVSQYRQLFPAIDFSLIENDSDVLWQPDTREKDEEVAARGLKFLKWLWTCEEKEIAVVTHADLLFHTLSAFGNDCDESIKREICSQFANCELRSMVIVDKSLIGSDSSTTNYPGNISN